MAAARKIKPEDAVINGNPLMRAEVDRFVENSEKVSSFQQIAQYMLLPYWLRLLRQRLKLLALRPLPHRF